jgi:hypothetical protein
MDAPLPLFTTAHLTDLGRDRPDRDDSDELARIRRGVYAPRRAWVAAPADERYRHRVLAAARTLAAGTVFSHESAAALLGLPVLRSSDRIHVLAERAAGGRSQLDVVRHCLGLERAEPWVVDGVLVTGPARTVLDIAATRTFEGAVVVGDALLRLYPNERDGLDELVDWFGSRRGATKLRRAHRFLDGAAASPGESISRVRMHVAGFVAPVLQFEVRTGSHCDFTDFAWPEEGAVGEFDGEVKYREDRYRAGGTAEDVVIREKNRENRIRRSYPRFARWDARDLRRSGTLEQILTAAGVPHRRLAR